MSLADSYFATATELLSRAREKNAATLAALAPIIGKSIAGGGVIDGNLDAIATVEHAPTLPQ